MTQQPSSTEAISGRYPLSFTQQYFHSLDEGDLNGAFGNRFTIVSALRIAGHVDVATLQAALDDVVARHELLRTVVVRDADPPYQQIYPPTQVPLDIRDLPVTDRPRDLVAEELVIEAEKETMTPRQVPVIRAHLIRFDDADSVLSLVVHHSASDAWSQNVVMRDLAAYYDARANGHPVRLKPVKQYREYSEWQKANAAETSDARKYWREKLRDARVFALPNDRPRPQVYSRPFSAYNYVIRPAELAETLAFANKARSSMFMLLMAAFSVFAASLTGQTDPAIRAFTTGRDEPTFQNTMGLFLNLVPFQTDISGCSGFREVVASVRDTCIDAYASEVPITVIEQDLPAFNAPHDEPGNSQFILGMYQAQASDDALPIADGAEPILKRTLASAETSDIPSGLVWNMSVTRDRALLGNVVYNLDEFDEQRVTGWVADFNRIMLRLVSEPDRDWRELTGAAS